LTSPIEIEVGAFPVTKSVLAENVGVEAPGEVVLINTETVAEAVFATTRSGFPSPFKSPSATNTGPLPVVKSVLPE
jgi:hypothetical protein